MKNITIFRLEMVQKYGKKNFSRQNFDWVSIGQKIAMIEMKITISKILRNFDIRLMPGEKVTEVHSITLGPKDGLFMELETRE